jgi:pimeloyl-ACP methyl ester carboxylesterase
MLLAVGWGLSACSSSGPTADLPVLYNTSAQDHGIERNPVILIPGILGSRLKDTATDTLVWGAFTGEFANPNRPSGARMAALPMAEGAPLRELHDEVRPDGALEEMRVRFLGLPIQLDAYVDILRTLGIGGYRDESGSLGEIDYGEEHFTCFQFDYDWRRDNVENAQRLHAFIEDRRAYVQEEYRRRYGVEDYDVQFDIVAHSMGGLLTRYFLRYGAADLPEDGSTPEVTWAGAEHVERAILVGTPSAGSAQAVWDLVQGKKTSPITPTYPPAVIGTFPALYQLMPRDRHEALVDATDTTQAVEGLYNVDFWVGQQWGLADPGQREVLEVLLPEVDNPATRYRIAVEHLQKSLTRAEHFNRALDTPTDRPDGLDLMLMAGDAEQTPAQLAVDRRTGALMRHSTDAGDGTVLRSSALMDERVGGAWSSFLNSPIDWSHVTFLFAGHVDMTRDPTFTDNLLYYLLMHPRNRSAVPPPTAAGEG